MNCPYRLKVASTVLQEKS
uniref:Uncharacterized protein n=1 Tax=Pyricularia oryzae (strain 70-15 / ATCC MYA-4617 / FGSC 8958) TaxID=242507 RepID=Q2KF18_PYRO7|nr:hypothetical protein MGCH7_ch7g868 [Pyricularia oryzae 70-15]